MGNIYQLKNTPLQIRSEKKNSENADLFLYGDVGGDFFGEGITAKSVAASLKEVDGAKNLTIHLSSFGGSVFEGIAIYNLLSRFKAKKTVIIEGIAASIASVIMLAGDEIIMGEGALVMIHKPFCYCVGNSTELETMISRLDEIENQILGIYARKTKLSRSDLIDMLAKETWFTADEAVEKGFASSKSEDNIYIAASLIQDCSWIKKKQQLTAKNSADKAMSDKVENLRKEIGNYLARK